MTAGEPATAGLPPPERAAERCAVCDGVLVGRFCHACGERRPHPDDESLVHFLREQFAEVTSADGRLWRSVRALFVPGKLTVEYFSGRRGLYLRPVRLFLIGNVLFFLLLTVFGANSIFMGTADSFRTGSDFGRWASGEMAAAAAESGVEQATYDAAFTQHGGTLATTLIAVLIPGLALTLALALFWARASGVRHLVFATHFLAFATLGSTVIAVALIPVQIGFQFLGRFGIPDPIGYSLDPIIGVVLTVYFVFAVRRVYGKGWPATLGASTVALALFSVIVVQGYQAFLFVVTLWTVDVPA